jgi:hypothetical protein
MWAPCKQPLASERPSSAKDGLRRALYALALLLLALIALRERSVRAAAAPTGIAIVVGQDSPITSITLDELKEYYVGDRGSLPNGETAQPTMRPAGSAEKDIFLRHVLNMSERDFKQIWLARIYRGEASSSPLVLDSDVSVRRYVSQVSSAVGYIDRSAPTTGVRVLLVVRDGP